MIYESHGCGALIVHYTAGREIAQKVAGAEQDEPCGLVTAYPNADPETVENAVAKLVEGAVRTVPDVRNVTLVSRENISMVITEFNWGTNLDRATGEVSARLDALNFELPDEVERPMVLRFDPTQLPVAILGVGGKGDIVEVTRKVEETVKPGRLRCRRFCAS